MLLYLKRTDPQISKIMLYYKKQDRPLLQSRFAGAQNLKDLIDLKVEIKLCEKF